MYCALSARNIASGSLRHGSTAKQRSAPGMAQAHHPGAAFSTCSLSHAGAVCCERAETGKTVFRLLFLFGVK